MNMCNKSNKDDLLKHVNDNNKTIEGYITTLLPAVLALINSQIYNAVIYFYIYLVSGYFLNFLFNIFLRKVERNRENGKKGDKPKNPNNPDGFNETQKTHMVILEPKEKEGDITKTQKTHMVILEPKEKNKELSPDEELDRIMSKFGIFS